VFEVVHGALLEQAGLLVVAMVGLNRGHGLAGVMQLVWQLEGLQVIDTGLDFGYGCRYLAKLTQEPAVMYELFPEVHQLRGKNQLSPVLVVADGLEDLAGGGVIAQIGMFFLFFGPLDTGGLVLDGMRYGSRSSVEVMELVGKPFIFSHANPYRICPNRRNVRDDQILKYAATGGAIGITL
jgi:hypothetical protein